jgi:vacuolar protein sorting-associated protein IST1
VIATDIAVEVMEMVELYCELLLARANVLDQLAFGEQGTRARLRAKELYKKQTQAQTGEKAATSAAPESTGSRFGFSWLGGSQKKEANIVAATSPLEGAGELSEEENPYMDTALDEAAVAIFYAWHRFPHELRELTMLRTMLGERYGKEFMTMAQDNKVDSAKVPDRLLKGLRVRPPTQELVGSYLREIAKAYGVEWPGGEDIQEELGDAPPEFVDDAKGGADEDQEGDLPQTPNKQRADPASQPSLSEARRASETSELNKATPPRGPAALQGRSPVSVAPPAPRTDNPNPRVKVPGSEEDGVGATKKAGTSKNNNSGIPELDELTRRFADLKRKP